MSVDVEEFYPMIRHNFKTSEQNVKTSCVWSKGCLGLKLNICRTQSLLTQTFCTTETKLSDVSAWICSSLSEGIYLCYGLETSGSFTSHHLEKTWHDMHILYQHKTNEMCFRNHAGAHFLFLFFFLNKASTEYLKGTCLWMWTTKPTHQSTRDVTVLVLLRWDMKTPRWHQVEGEHLDRTASLQRVRRKSKINIQTDEWRPNELCILPRNMSPHSKECHWPAAHFLFSISLNSWCWSEAAGGTFHKEWLTLSERYYTPPPSRPWDGRVPGWRDDKLTIHDIIIFIFFSS